MASDERPASGPNGEQAAAISRAMVGILRRYAGRGPTRVRTTVGRDHVLVVLYETLTTVEKTVVDHGAGALIDQTRKAVQDAMEPEARAMVENLTGREVVAFMSVNHMKPDCAAELFITRSDPDPSRDEAPPAEAEAEAGGE